MSKYLGVHDFSPENVKKFRLSKGMSQAAFAKKLGVSQATVSKSERDRDSLNVSYLVKMKAAFPMRVEPPKFVKPKFWKLCKLRFKYEFGLYPKAGIRPVTFDAFVRQTVIDETSN